MDISGLVTRAKEGLVTKAEIAEVARLLVDRADDEHTYSLLYVIGRTRATEYEELVAGFLDEEEHPSVAALALQVLCTFWNLTDRYAEQVRRFLEGVEWDFFGEVRLIAISAAGRYLAVRTHCPILRGLLALCAADDESWVERRVALEAVASALGDPVGETLRAGGARRETWAQDVLARGQARLALECG
jgi:hypothetical protein